MGFAGVGGGGAEVGCEASVVPAGPRGWESRAPMFVQYLKVYADLVRRQCQCA